MMLMLMFDRQDNRNDPSVSPSISDELNRHNIFFVHSIEYRSDVKSFLILIVLIMFIETAIEHIEDNALFN